MELLKLENLECELKEINVYLCLIYFLYVDT